MIKIWEKKQRKKKGIWGWGVWKMAKEGKEEGVVGKAQGRRRHCGESPLEKLNCVSVHLAAWLSLYWFLFQLHSVNLMVSCASQSSSQSRECLVIAISTQGLWMTKQQANFRDFWMEAVTCIHPTGGACLEPPQHK